MSEVVISLLCVIAILVALIVLLAVQFFRALRDVLDHAESSHARNMSQLDRVVDRFMAADFGAYKAYQMAETADEGGQIMPGADEEESSRPWTARPPDITTEEGLEEAREHWSLTGRELGANR